MCVRNVLALSNTSEQLLTVQTYLGRLFLGKRNANSRCIFVEIAVRLSELSWKWLLERCLGKALMNELVVVGWTRSSFYICRAKIGDSPTR